MFGRNDEKYLGIDAALRNIEPIPLSPRQRTNVAKLKPYPFIIIGVVYLLFLAVPLVNGDKHMIGFMIGIATFIAAIVILLVIKDKLRINSFERVYIVRGFIEKKIYTRSGYTLRMRYHDFLRNEIKVINKTEPPELLFDKSVTVEGRGVELIMGEKNGKLSYITIKTPKIEM
ncbi:MAG: hypothetical protein IJ045_08175 [Ruminiclostridium sp.]|nr:hypothetical protein [Ruminiclostridium sp.]